MKSKRGIQIRDIAVYHPNTVRDNQYYLNQYEDKERELAKSVMEEILGRDRRYVIEPGNGENSLSLSIAASKAVLEKTGLSGSDIDGIIVCSITAEYMSPTQALMVHNEIQGRVDAFCFDLRAACIGMVSGIDIAGKFIKMQENTKRVLVVAAECMSLIWKKEDIVDYTCFGEAACAVIVEATNDSSKDIHTRYWNDNRTSELIPLPKKGLTERVLNSDCVLEFELSPSESISLERCKPEIQRILRDNHITLDDIKIFCVSQLSKQLGEEIYEALAVPMEKRIYIGDKYGYTGANCTYICLYEAIKQGRVERGDYILIWTMGYGDQYVVS
ncbi:MAG TPA: hypothetical protein DCW90_16900, partial [Lachnospiraceae bacterium]|nr:hypothetical protein [Lachnospiraceae bacterium]